MAKSIEEYIDIVGDHVIGSIFNKAGKLYHRHVINLNSTFQGGGVAEMLSRLVPIMNYVGVNAEWRILHGNPAFYDVTKQFHNGLQSGDIELTQQKKDLYLNVNQEFAIYTHLDKHDCVILHDPQPMPLVKYCRKSQPWIWRCHIDLTEPNKELWNFLKPFLLRYDVVIFSSEKYKKDDLPVEQRIIHPAIDPLALKNKDMTEKEIARYIKKAKIPTDKPIITQVSRMDPWKDPEGVMDVYEKVRSKVDCRLVYCYNLASDDPEGMHMYEKVYRKAKKFVDKGDVIFVLGNNDYLVNAIQRFSDVVIQKSTKEGFCLAVTEALWKAKPVVATNVGGIPIQVKDGETGFLVDPFDIQGCADRVIEVLKNKTLARHLGKNAKEFVRENFLTTRLMMDYLDLFIELTK